MKKYLFIILIILISTSAQSKNFKKVYFAGGCFWCMEESFDGVEGYVDFEVGEFDSDANSTRTVFQAAVGGPLSETVAARAAIRVSQHDGYLKNLYTRP